MTKCICADYLNNNPNPMTNPDCPVHGSIGRTKENTKQLQADNKKLKDALLEITKCEGAFSMDRLTHAMNVIENMRSIAMDALYPGNGENE